MPNRQIYPWLFCLKESSLLRRLPQQTWGIDRTAFGKAFLFTLLWNSTHPQLNSLLEIIAPPPPPPASASCRHHDDRTTWRRRGPSLRVFWRTTKQKKRTELEGVLFQKHFLCTMAGPLSSYSCLEIHICWKVDREARMEPPIHTEYFRSGGAITFTLTESGAMADNSLVIRSAMPGDKRFIQRDDWQFCGHLAAISGNKRIMQRDDWQFCGHLAAML